MPTGYKSDLAYDCDKVGIQICRAFIGEDILPFLCEEARSGPMRRTRLGNGTRECWTEYGVRAEGLLSEILTGTHARRLIEAAVGSRQWTSQMWVHHYASRERIPWHRDAAGDLQLVLCLLAPPAVNGGLFLLRHNGKTVAVDLRPGDAMLFRATKTLHATTRLRPTTGVPNPERIVAVARFYEVKE